MSEMCQICIRGVHRVYVDMPFEMVFCGSKTPKWLGAGRSKRPPAAGPNGGAPAPSPRVAFRNSVRRRTLDRCLALKATVEPRVTCPESRLFVLAAHVPLSVSDLVIWHS